MLVGFETFLRVSCRYSLKVYIAVPGSVSRPNMAKARKIPPGIQMKDIFREVAKSCAAQVRNLPKGERVRAYRQCIKEGIKAKLAALTQKV